MSFFDLVANDVGDLLLGLGAFVSRLERDEGHALVGFAAVEATDVDEVVGDGGIGGEDLLELRGFLGGERERRADGSLEADDEDADVLFRCEFHFDESNGAHGGGKEQQRAGDNFPAVAETEGERVAVGAREGSEDAVDPDGEAVLVFLGSHELRAAHGGEGDGLEERERDGGGDGHAELEKKDPNKAADEEDGNKDHDDGGGGRDGGEGNFARAVHRGLAGGFAHVEMAHDVFEHHDGVVDDDADGERHAEEGKEIYGEPEQPHDDESAEGRRGDGEQDVERRGPRAEEGPADEAGHDDGEQNRDLGLADGVGGEAGAVEVDVDVEIGIGDGEFLVDLLDEGADGGADLDVVGAVLLLDADTEGGFAVAPGEAADVGEAVLDAGDVAEVNVGMVNALAAALGDEQVAHLLWGEGLTADADVGVVDAVLEVARGRLAVLHFKRVADVEDGELVGEELVVIDPDAEVAVGPAAENHVADAGDDADAVAQIQVDVGEDVLV